MGLASSQARLLLLTARKSDLEFRAQQITNSEMILAMQTEEVARKYSRKLSNQTLFFQDKDSNEREFTAKTLPTLSAGSGTQMHLQVCSNGVWRDWTDTEHQETTSYKDASGKEISVREYNALSEADKANYTAVQSTLPADNNYTSAKILNGINNGTMKIVYSEGDKQGETVDAINGTAFTVGYDKSDDAEADAEYRSKTAAIQIKEKRLQMDLNQVETQQKACDTEYESVKKIMDKNIDRTFKVFS